MLYPLKQLKRPEKCMQLVHMMNGARLNCILIKDSLRLKNYIQMMPDNIQVDDPHHLMQNIIYSVIVLSKFLVHMDFFFVPFITFNTIKTKLQ